MKNQLQHGEAPKNVYVAWSLYTGPANVNPLWEHSRWITGQWNGINNIKNDIDGRIDALIGSFCCARKNLSPEQKNSAMKYFVIPEFYFHSKFGPYPKIEINGEYPYEYILSSLQKKLSEQVELLKNEIWVLCIGSVLTCNIYNISDFLKSCEVQERLKELNSKVGPSQLKSIRMKKDPYIKAMGYIHAKDVLSDWKEEIDSLMKAYRADPLCIVRNRGAVLKIHSGSIECFCYEKQNEATADLTMGILNGITGIKDKPIDPGGMITEWVAGYPLSSIIDGDKNPESSPTAARISIKDPDIELGIEVCLDHRFKRLRRTVGMTKENGAVADNPPLDVQLITSGGMQILDESVAARHVEVDKGGAICKVGAIFDADGCDPILNNYGPDGKPIIDGSGSERCIACGVYMSSAQTMAEVDSHKYFSHSQLSFRYGNAEIGGYDNAKGTLNDKGPTYIVDGPSLNPILDSYQPPKIEPVNGKEPNKLYAAGWGKLHIYIPNTETSTSTEH